VLSRVAVPVPELRYIYSHSHVIPIGKWDEGISFPDADLFSRQLKMDCSDVDLLTVESTVNPYHVLKPRHCQYDVLILE